MWVSVWVTEEITLRFWVENLRCDRQRSESMTRWVIINTGEKNRKCAELRLCSGVDVAVRMWFRYWGAGAYNHCRPGNCCGWVAVVEIFTPFCLWLVHEGLNYPLWITGSPKDHWRRCWSISPLGRRSLYIMLSVFLSLCPPVSSPSRLLCHSESGPHQFAWHVVMAISEEYTWEQALYK